MTTECIHGLESARCDVCSPKAQPKSDPAVRPASRVRAASRTRTARPLANGTAHGTTHSTAPAGSPRRSVNLGEQRIHHVTHLSNLAAILSSAALFADACEAWDARPTVDISSRDNRNLRRSTILTGGVSVAGYVPFYLSPNAHLWEVLRAGSRDPRLAAASRWMPAAEFVILVSTIKKISGLKDAADDIAVTDRDAADPRARATTARDDNERMLRRLIADQTSDTLVHAEFLVKDTVPLESFPLIGVANDKARKAVRAVLESGGYQPRIAVHPPWFAAPAED